MPYAKNTDLPEAVRNVLPTEAQNVFRAAYNAHLAANETASEASGMKIAWTAVKNGWSPPKEDGGMWTRKMKDSSGFSSIELYDTFSVDAKDVKPTEDGYLVATPRVARTGIQLYRGYEVGRPEMDVVRVFRPDSEVFSVDSMHSYAFRPVTNDHPPVPVNATNWKTFTAGQTGGEVARDGDFVRVPMVLMDAAVIKDYEGGKNQLSLGYTTDLKFEPGKTPSGEVYDAVQTKIRANHLAVVKAARGGDSLRIGDDDDPDRISMRGLLRGTRDHHQREGNPAMNDKTLKPIVIDGITVEVTDQSAQFLQRALATYDTTIADLKKRLETADALIKTKDGELAAAADKSKKELETKDAELLTTKKQLEDAKAALTPAKLDEMVKDRMTVVTKAKTMLGDKLVIDGKSVDDVKRQVVDAKLGDVSKGWTPEQIAASFNTITADVKVGSVDRLADALSDSHGSNNAMQSRDKAYDEYATTIGGAWKTPMSKAS